MRGTLLSSSISRITKSARKVNLPTLMSIFSTILTGYWNYLSANLTLILVGLRVLRDSFAYKEYGIGLMLAPRSAKALQEKVLLKLHGIRKLPGFPSFGGTLFWIIAELSSLRKAAKICLILCLLLMSSLRNFPYLGIPAKMSTRGSSSSSSLSKLIGFRVATPWVWLSVACKRSRRSPRLLDSESVELSFEELQNWESERQHGRQPTWVHHPLDRNFKEYQESDGSNDVKNWRVDVGIKSFLMLFGVTAALIDVNAAQSNTKLLLLEEVTTARGSYYCYYYWCKVTTAEGVNAASEEVSTAEL
ncbi:hypothetical protein Tco_1224603, partial [Tanacetum coccineum]